MPVAAFCSGVFGALSPCIFQSGAVVKQIDPAKVRNFTQFSAEFCDANRSADAWELLAAKQIDNTTPSYGI